MNDHQKKDQYSGVRDQEIRAAFDQHWVRRAHPRSKQNLLGCGKVRCRLLARRQVAQMIIRRSSLLLYRNSMFITGISSRKTGLLEFDEV